MTSPFAGRDFSEWGTVTERLVAEHPLSHEAIVESVFAAWAEIFQSTLGSLRIGRDIFPQAVPMGFFLHELIPVEVAQRHEGWKRGTAKGEKDLLCTFDGRFSVEIKTSSHKSNVFGNRSYAQATPDAASLKSGYYLTVNFESFAVSASPEIARVRFGWLDHDDWIGQKSQTGQQAHIRPEADQLKLVEIYRKLKRR